jgi:hypothetical protein
VPASTSGQHTEYLVFCEAICLPLRLWRDQLRGSRLIVVVAGPARYEGRAHASSMGSHVASNTLAWAETCFAMSLDRSIAAGGLSERDMFAGSWRGSWVLLGIDDAPVLKVVSRLRRIGYGR